jgi:hypothetical protein
VTVDQHLWQQLNQIRHAPLSKPDQEILRPAFAALDGGQVIAIPDRVVARIRDIAARMPKQ